MHVPVLCERVRVRGTDEVYFVVTIDDERQEVNLIPVSGSAPSLNAVPFADLRRGPFVRPDSHQC